MAPPGGFLMPILTKRWRSHIFWAFSSRAAPYISQARHGALQLHHPAHRRGSDGVPPECRRRQLWLRPQHGGGRRGLVNLHTPGERLLNLGDEVINLHITGERLLLLGGEVIKLHTPGERLLLLGGEVINL